MQPASSPNDGAVAPPVADDGTSMAEAPQWPAGGSGEDAKVVEESPRFPVGEARPRMAPLREEVYESSGEGPDDAMAEPPGDTPSYAMAEPTMAAAPASVPMAPETSNPRPAATAAAPVVPRVNLRSPPAPQQDYQVVEVFYGTDRARRAPAELETGD